MGVIAVGGDVPPELLADERVSFPAVFLARGAADEWYTAIRYEADLSALRSRGVTVHGLVYDGGHQWTTGVGTAAAQWLADLIAAGTR